MYAHIKTKELQLNRSKNITLFRKYKNKNQWLFFIIKNVS